MGCTVLAGHMHWVIQLCASFGAVKTFNSEYILQPYSSALFVISRLSTNV